MSARRRIAFQGEPGANGDEACRLYFPELEPTPYAAFEDAFEAVRRGDCAFALIPVENSIAGRVADVHHLLPSSGLRIVGERFKPIRFQLMANPGVRLEDVRTVLGEPDGWKLDFTERVVGNRSPVTGELMDMISAWIGEHDPGARTVPVILPGFTDSRHFRLAFPDCVAYGFFPQRHQSLLDGTPLIHSADERIDVRDLAFATELYSDLARRILS